MVEKPQPSVRHFKLWDSYGPEDERLFFGRDREMKVLYDKTFASNLLLLYGASGSGKTSLIQCGLSNQFDKNDWFPIFIRKGDHILKSISVALRQATNEPAKLRNSSIREKIHQLFLEKFRPIFLIFDQFEELFILGDRQEQEQFFSLLIELLGVNFQCKIIVSIKEDYLAELDRYEEAIPMLFYNRMRVERMRTEQLEAVVTGLAGAMAIQLGPEDAVAEEVEPLVTRILDKVRDDTRQVDLGELQVFLDELYLNDERRRQTEGDPTRPIRFDEALVAQTGHVDDVIAKRLQKHLIDLDQQLQQAGAGVERIPYLLLQLLVTQVETKRTRRVEDLVEQLFARHKIEPAQVQACLTGLIRNGILRKLVVEGQRDAGGALQGRDRVEIIHDNLAKKLHPLLFSEERNIIKIKNFILNQYEYYQETGVLLNREDLEYIRPYLDEIREELPGEQHQFIAQSRRETRKRQRQWMALLGGIGIVLVLSTIFAFVSRARSQRQAAANQIGAQALDALSFDRTLALRLAEMALERDPGNTLANNVRNDVLIHSWTFPLYQEVFRIEEEEVGRITDLDVSRNEDYLVAGSLDGHIYLLKLNAFGRRQRSLLRLEQRHGGEITDVDFLGELIPGEYHFMTASRDGTAKVWRIASDREVELLTTLSHHSALTAVYYSRKDSALFAAGERRLYQWKWAAGQSSAHKRDSFLLSQTAAFEFIDQGERQYLLAAARDTLRLRQLGGPDTTFQYRIAAGAVASMDYAKGQGKLALGLQNGDLVTLELSARFFAGDSRQRQLALDESLRFREAHSEAVQDVVFINEGSQILTSSEDKSAKLWDADLSLVKTFLGHNDGVQSITGDGDVVYTGGEDRTIKRWRLHPYRPKSLELPAGDVVCAAYADSTLLLGLEVNKVNKLVFFELAEEGKRLVKTKEIFPKGKLSKFSHVALSRNGVHILLATAYPPAVELVDREGTTLRFLEGGTDTLSSIAFSAEDRYFLINMGTNSLIWERKPGGRSYVVRDTFVYSGALREAAPLTLANERSFGLSVASRHAGRRALLLFAVRRGDNRAFVYSPLDSLPIDTIVHANDILNLAVSADGQHLLTGSRDNSFTLATRNRRFLTGRREGMYEVRRFQRHTDDVNVVAFSPAGDSRAPQRFLTASQDGTVRLWDISGRERPSLINHGAPIRRALFLTETLVLTYGADGRVLLWDTEQFEAFIADEVYAPARAARRGLLQR